MGGDAKDFTPSFGFGCFLMDRPNHKAAAGLGAVLHKKQPLSRAEKHSKRFLVLLVALTIINVLVFLLIH